MRWGKVLPAVVCTDRLGRRGCPPLQQSGQSAVCGSGMDVIRWRRRKGSQRRLHLGACEEQGVDPVVLGDFVE